MKGPGSWNRRSFDVTPNGYFTVLKPTRWFPTVRLPDGFRYLIGESGKPKRQLGDQDGPSSPLGGVGQETIIDFQLVGSTDGKRSLLRVGLIVLGAIAISFGLLLFIDGFSALSIRHKTSTAPCPVQSAPITERVGK